MLGYLPAGAERPAATCRPHIREARARGRGGPARARAGGLLRIDAGQHRPGGGLPAAPLGLHWSETEPAARTGRPESAAMTPRQTILLADDQVWVRQLVRLTLAAETYLILEAADGDEAWAILQIMRPDVALLDVG